MRPRRALLIAGAIGLLGASPRVHAQPAATLRRVGILNVGTDAEGGTMRAPFKLGMQELGWREGNNVEYRVAAAAGDVGRLETLARELVARGVEVIVAPTASTTRAALRATVGDAGDVASRPPQTGSESPRPPGRRRRSSRSESWSLALAPVWVDASTPAEPAGAVEQIVGQRAQAVVVPADALYYSERARLHALLLAKGLPTACGHRENVVAGGLLGYTSNYVANFRHAAKFDDKILKGARPAEMPIEQPTKFELIVNLKTARTLGITLPQSVRLRADEVIE